MRSLQTINTLAFAAALWLTGCTDGQKAMQQGAAGTVAGQQQGGSGSVQLLPEIPTAQEDIRVVHSGNGPVSYRWYVNGEALADESGPVLPRAAYTKGDTVSVVVTIDGKEFPVSTSIVNSPPRIIAVPLANQKIHAGVDITIAPKAFDADGEEVRYRFQWTLNDEKLSEEGPTLAGSRIRKGDRITLTVTPSDSDGDGEPYTPPLLVVPNAPPLFVSTPTAAFTERGYHYQARAFDADGDLLTYTLALSPPGMKIDSETGMIEWGIDDARAGEQLIEVVAKDPEGLKATQQYTLAVTLPKEREHETK